LPLTKVYLERKMSDKYILHFNTRIKATDRNKLTRQNYCVPTTAPSYETKKNILLAQDFFEKNNRYPMLCPQHYCNIPNSVFADNEHYTEQWVKQHYSDCMENFDLNMSFFDSLDENNFTKHLNSFVKKNKLREVFDLKDIAGIEGIYVLVLGQYKQAYIGKSSDIKRRILGHWSRKKEFDHLICGRVDESVISIDSFGALDTTQIFYKRVSWRDIDEVEEKLVSSFKGEYLINRVAGGLNAENVAPIRNLQLLASMKKRELK